MSDSRIPETRVSVTRVRKLGDCYRVEGHVDGRAVSADLHAAHVDARDRASAERLFHRSLRLVAQATPQ